MASTNFLTESQEHSMYISQLKEVFDSCDVAGVEKLGRKELFSLCEKLQLDDQAEFLVEALLAETEKVENFLNCHFSVFEFYVKTLKWLYFT